MNFILIFLKLDLKLRIFLKTKNHQMYYNLNKHVKLLKSKRNVYFKLEKKKKKTKGQDSLVRLLFSLNRVEY